MFFLFVGDIYECYLTDPTKPHDARWVKVDGHLKRVVCGWNDIVWGFGFDGMTYVRSDNVSTMESQEDHLIYENQRWNPVGGFTQRLVNVSPGFISLLKRVFHMANFSARVKFSVFVHALNQVRII